jgi:hypothetical protein
MLAGAGSASRGAPPRERKTMRCSGSKASSGMPAVRAFEAGKGMRKIAP